MQDSTWFPVASVSLLLVSLAGTGCATKKYVEQQATPIRQRIGDIEKQQTEALAKLEAKERNDISRLEERTAVADAKAEDAARAAQAADRKAAEAREAAERAAASARDSQARLGDLDLALTNLDSLKVFGTEQILFRVNRYALSREHRATLDQFVHKLSAMNRYVIEVKGFADKGGPQDYNLALSRRRADAVTRHLVDLGVPLRRIHTVGLGAGDQRRVIVTVYTP